MCILSVLCLFYKAIIPLILFKFLLIIICSSFLFLSSMSNIVFETVTNLPSTDSFWMFSFLGCFNFSLPFDFGPLSIHVSSSSVAVPCFPVISDVCCPQVHCSTKFCLNVLCYIFHNFHLLRNIFLPSHAYLIPCHILFVYFTDPLLFYYCYYYSHLNWVFSRPNFCRIVVSRDHCRLKGILWLTQNLLTVRRKSEYVYICI